MSEQPAPKPTIDLKDYRQPMVTAIGIMLGFLVGFLGNWVSEPTFSLADDSAKIAFYGPLAGSVCLFVALLRMLNIAPVTDVISYYQRTLHLFSLGVILALSSIFASGFL